jgi:hypothetical protein
MFTPPSAAEKAAQNQGLQYASAPNTAKRSQTALVEPPLTSAQTPSAEGHDDMIHTPVSDQLSRNPSARNPANIREGKVALDEDPEVRRDFEARIAAATAALNRTPTTSGSKLERKPTKKGVFSISSPKLVSSSSNVPTNPLSPPEAPIDASTKKALEKTSGSGKGSGRWRKLGFRSRPSVSGQNTPETATPTPMPRPSHRPNRQLPVQLLDLLPRLKRTSLLLSSFLQTRRFRLILIISSSRLLRISSLETLLFEIDRFRLLCHISRPCSRLLSRCLELKRPNRDLRMDPLLIHRMQRAEITRIRLPTLRLLNSSNLGELWA